MAAATLRLRGLAARLCGDGTALALALALWSSSSMSALAVYCASDGFVNVVAARLREDVIMQVLLLNVELALSSSVYHVAQCILAVVAPGPQALLLEREKAVAALLYRAHLTVSLLDPRYGVTLLLAACWYLPVLALVIIDSAAGRCLDHLLPPGPGAGPALARVAALQAAVIALSVALSVALALAFTEGGLHLTLLLAVDVVGLALCSLHALIRIAVNVAAMYRAGGGEAAAAAAEAEDLAEFALFGGADLVRLAHYLHVLALNGITLSLFSAVVLFQLKLVVDRLHERHAKFKTVRALTLLLDKRLADAPFTLLRPPPSSLSSASPGAADGLRRRRGEPTEDDGTDTEAEVQEQVPECAICFEPMTQAKLCSTCRAPLHRHCLRKWLSGKAQGAWSCPCCRSQLAPAAAAALPGAVPARPAPEAAAAGGLVAFLQQALTPVDEEVLGRLAEAFPNLDRDALRASVASRGLDATVDAAISGQIATAALSPLLQQPSQQPHQQPREPQEAPPPEAREQAPPPQLLLSPLPQSPPPPRQSAPASAQPEPVAAVPADLPALATEQSPEARRAQRARAAEARLRATVSR